jgi:very-long-chain (3R)-3-hydroxyacyl-CoA dehydratase
MDKAINLVNLLGWTYLLVQTEIELVFNLEDYVTSDISLSLSILRVIQLLQISDIILLLMGKAKGNLMAAFFQILGRNIVTLFVIEENTGRLVYAFVVIVWSIAEVNRYLYYIFKDSPITGFLRYNGFLILYPLGAVA